MVLTEDSYILGILYAEDKDGNNFMLTVIRHKDNLTEWEGEYRYRYRVDNKVFDSKDIKRIYRFKIKDKTEEQVEDMLKELLEYVKIKFTKFSEYVPIKGDTHKFAFIGAQQDWLHIKKEDYD